MIVFWVCWFRGFIQCVLYDYISILPIVSLQKYGKALKKLLYAKNFVVRAFPICIRCRIRPVVSLPWTDDPSRCEHPHPYITDKLKKIWNFLKMKVFICKLTSTMMLLVVPPILPRSLSAFWKKNQISHETPGIGRGRKMPYRKKASQTLKYFVKFVEVLAAYSCLTCQSLEKMKKVSKGEVRSASF